MLATAQGVDELAGRRLERLVAHVPTCPWCDGKAVALPRGGVRCYWCQLYTRDAQYFRGVRVWRRVQ